MSKSYCTHFLASLLVLIGAYSSHADEHLVEPLDILADPFVKQEGSLVSFLSDQCCDCGDTVSCGDGVDCGSAVGKKDNPSPCLISHKAVSYTHLTLPTKA